MIHINIDMARKRKKMQRGDAQLARASVGTRPVLE